MTHRWRRSSKTKWPAPSIATRRASASSRSNRFARGQRRERILGPPEDQRRRVDLGELSLPRLELLEVHRSIELERRRLSAPGGERLPVGVDLGLGESLAARVEQSGEATAVERADERLALVGAQRLGHPVPFAVGEEARVADHQAGDPIGVVAGPGEADEAAPVMDDDHSRLELELIDPGGESLAAVLERRRAEVGRVTEAVEVGGEPAPAGARGRLEQLLPHQRALGKAVHADKRRATRGSVGKRLPVGDRPLALELDRGHRAHPNEPPEPRYACRPPAPWRSGYAAACKAVYAGSIPAGASRPKYAASSGFSASSPGTDRTWRVAIG